MLRATLALMFLCSACTSERRIEVSLVFSPYCLALHLGVAPDIKADVTQLDDLRSISFDLIVLDREEIEMGRLAPVRGPYCASETAPAEQTVDIGGLLLDAVSLVANVPILADGSQYVLMGAMFPNETECQGQIEACALSGEFGEDASGDKIEMWALCPTSAEQQPCDSEDDCAPYFTGCTERGICEDIAPVTLAGYRASFESCRIFHAQAIEQAGGSGE